MASIDNIDQVISLYWEADRSNARKRYEALFGADDDSSQSDLPAPVATEMEEPTPREKIEPSPEQALENDLADGVMALRLSPDLAECITRAWRGYTPYQKTVALHLLNCAADKYWTTHYQLEGLVAWFGVGVATRILHQWYPDEVFQIDDGIEYRELCMTLRLLGIQCADDGERHPVDIILEIGKTAEAFRVRHNLKHWQVWALVYDLGPRLLPPRAPYPEDKPRVWLGAGNSNDFEAVDADKPADCHGWVINRKARRGDLVLMYLLRPRSAIVAVYRCACDAYRDPFLRIWTGNRVQITDKIDIPWLTINEMKADPILRDWCVVKCSFNNCLKIEVTSGIWDRIKELVRAKDAKAGDALDQYVAATGGVRTMIGRFERGAI